jgi:hypothetical protein
LFLIQSTFFVNPALQQKVTDLNLKLKQQLEVGALQEEAFDELKDKVDTQQK